MRRTFRVFLSVFCILYMFFACNAAEAVEKLRLCAIDPILGVVAGFIGGPYAEVQSAVTWNESGHFEFHHASVLGKETSSLPLIILDKEQYDSFIASSRRYRAAGKLRGRLYPLLGPGVRHSSQTGFYGDPANWPYTAQRVANILTELQPERYPFFQRRLGEFNARLRSTLLSGRKALDGKNFIYIGEVYRDFLSACGCTLRSMQGEEIPQYEALARMTPKAARRAAQRIRPQSRIVVDYTADSALRDAVIKYCNAVYITLPGDGDLLFFMHRIILALSSDAYRGQVR